eukprot:5250362-Alexandrium_andersonii.AAC.1
MLVGLGTSKLHNGASNIALNNTFEFLPKVNPMLRRPTTSERDEGLRFLRSVVNHEVGLGKTTMDHPHGGTKGRKHQIGGIQKGHQRAVVHIGRLTRGSLRRPRP